MAKRAAGQRLASVHTLSPAAGGSSGAPMAAPVTVQASGGAADAVAAAEGTLAIAQARLREALATSSRVPTAETRVRERRLAAHAAAKAAQVHRGLLLDAEDAWEVAKAAVEAGGDVAAQVSADRCHRALTAAQVAVVDAEADLARAEEELAAAEDHQAALVDQHSYEPLPVVMARVELAQAERDLAAARAALADQTGTLAPEFASLDAFVEQYLLPNWRHRPESWCATWWRHAEAISRLEAVWEAFEVMRREPAPAISTWWRDHLDPHMRALTSPSGTFAGCKTTRHEVIHQQQDCWGVTPPPEGLFHVDPDSPRQPRRAPHSQEA